MSFENIGGFKKKIKNIIVAYDVDDKPVTVNDMGCTGACSVLLKEALKPNLVQTLIKTPTFIYGGPFANIAHGCNSIMATKLALKMGEYAVTEAGFGADLGAKKFIEFRKYTFCEKTVHTLRPQTKTSTCCLWLIFNRKSPKNNSHRVL